MARAKAVYDLVAQDKSSDAMKGLFDVQQKTGLVPGPGGAAPAVGALNKAQAGTAKAGTVEKKDPQLATTNSVLKEIARNTAGERFAIAG